MKKFFLIFFLINSLYSVDGLEFFFKSDNSKLFFIRPFEMSEKKGYRVLIDFTFIQDTNRVFSRSVVNYTLKGKKSMPKADFLINFIVDEKQIVLEKGRNLFVEASDYAVRYTSSLSIEEVREILSAKEFTLNLFFQEENSLHTLIPDKRFKKNRLLMIQNIFSSY